MVREARDSIEQQRRDMIAACYANPNWDGKDNADKRSQYLKDINDHFNNAITMLYTRGGAREVEVDWSNPFYAAHKRQIERTKEMFQLDGETAGEAVDKEIDQQQNGKPEDNGNRWDDLDQVIPRNK